ncbi:hypothetical protein V5P93_003357 [Actinokineospora auranticolor]|uniref:Uncharacterized protein n=1 Tax=Actinokineospora auranticolor TaxID=155976 RepID=A0A2S6GP58_9PSEU|nr:hypothetical protein [Actinokineospora auranticolor]PPK67018.1 hypothetical protein CLV40_10814 [Actinokineospora auranticolor]
MNFRKAMAVVIAMASMIAASTVEAHAVTGPNVGATQLSGAKVHALVDPGTAKGIQRMTTAEAVAPVEKAVDLVNRGVVQLHLGAGKTAVTTRAQAYAAGNLTSVRIPVEGSDIIAPSNVLVFFGADGTLRTYLESQFSPLTADSGKVTVWADGKLRGVKYAYNDGTVSDTPSTGSGEVIAQSWWGRFSDCLNSMGVAGWIINAIGAVCAIACIITAGAGCVACALTVAAGLSWEFTYCAAKADNG